MRIKIKTSKHRMFSCILWISIIWGINPILAQQQTKSNDNEKYFYDISVESGVYIPLNYSGFSSGSIICLHGSYFFNEKLGMRSGISLITGCLDADATYWKFPVLFAYRTNAIKLSLKNKYGEYDHLGDIIIEGLMHLIPSTFELNIGPSLGYVNSFYGESYFIDQNQKFLSETYEITQNFASSIDANVRISYQFRRICLNGNFGINYLLTKNYQSQRFYPGLYTYHPDWFCNLSLGVSFRF